MTITLKFDDLNASQLKAIAKAISKLADASFDNHDSEEYEVFEAASIEFSNAALVSSFGNSGESDDSDESDLPYTERQFSASLEEKYGFEFSEVEEIAA